MSDGYDLIVVGSGAMGASTCAWAAARGARVLGLERFGIPHERGSYHGETRVFRLCYYEHPDYVPLLRRGLELWEDLEAACGEPIMQTTGGLYMGPPEGAFIAGTIRAAREHGLDHEVLDGPAIARAFPQFRIPRDFIGVREPRAGLLRPERIVAAYAEAALRDGAELHGHEPVLDWNVDEGGVTVRTARGAYAAAHLVLCAGAWTGRWLTALDVPLTVTRQVAGWVWPKRPEQFRPGRMGVWGIDDPDGQFFYGFPMVPGRPGVKIARHHRGPSTDADTIDREVRTEDKAEIRRAIRRHLPSADGPLLSASVCMYVNTPDGHFIIDRHPRYERVTIAAGFSGHGFKFSSVLGQALAELALDGGTDLPVSFLGLARFAPGAGSSAAEVPPGRCARFPGGGQGPGAGRR